MDKSLIGKSCKLFVDINTHSLFFQVREITSITDTHISFLDKYNNYYCFRKQDVVEINEIS